MKEYKFRESKPKPVVGNRKWIQKGDCKKLASVYSHLNMGTKTMSKRKKDE
jgi:hypothetical protein|tara:strand:+ start:29 stop:181 length:153 start_codon:yes stop_codon:yes gene_type:complete